MNHWAQDAQEALAQGRPAALVTVLATEGSSPREAGTRMVVTEGALIGTIGGGNLEHQVARQARALLRRPAGEWRVQDYPLGPLLGQCCGGRVRVMLENLDPERSDWLAEAARGQPLAVRFEADRLVRLAGGTGAEASARGPSPAPGDVLVERTDQALAPVLILGVGHVGRALLRALEPLPFAVEALDVRPDLDPPVQVVSEAEAVARVASPGPDASVLIMTHDHALDYRLVGAALGGDAGFVGLIGSKTKRARFLSRLRTQGFSDAALGRLVCPIGLPGVTGKEPAVIAAAVAAQLLLRASDRS